MDIADFDQFPQDAVWLQQDDETNASYAAFCIYRDMGVRRSLRQTCQTYYELADLPARTDGKVTQISSWSQKYDWVERAWAYTAHLDRMARIEATEAAKQMGRRHAAIASVAIAKAAERINAVDPSKLSTREAVALLDLGVKVERMARGQSAVDDDATDDTEERSFKAAVAADPALALAARDIALALEGMSRHQVAAPAVDTPTPPVDETIVESPGTPEAE